MDAEPPALLRASEEANGGIKSHAGYQNSWKMNVHSPQIVES
jgi:hypothetical protein